ncbi:MAG: inositol monophosphatase family protein [Rhodospirillaceae bacterium]
MADHADGVADIIREVAVLEIMPWFKKLSAADIDEKNPGDLVTVADRAAGTALAKRLSEISTGALIVGEESHETSPDNLASLGSADAAWIIDPLDGTRNFANGVDRFASLVAYCRRGETVREWIFDLVNGRMALAEKRGGALLDVKKLLVPAAKPIRVMTGFVGPWLADKIRGEASARGCVVSKQMLRCSCVGLIRKYMDLAQGRLDFGRYAGKLMPWDHAAGVLLYQQAGGRAALGPGERPYGPARRAPRRSPASGAGLLDPIGGHAGPGLNPCARPRRKVFK